MVVVSIAGFAVVMVLLDSHGGAWAAWLLENSHGFGLFIGDGFSILFCRFVMLGHGQSFGENVVIISAGIGSLNRQRKRSSRGLQVNQPVRLIEVLRQLELEAKDESARLHLER
ncbi:hypothetical protein M0R45_019508 [Rubus argutus]|uniref:Secreted protein n=1 Tax=Rubus argutus TaxID=59490 RepID=A0AAW1X6E8_RUBAR